MEIGLVEWEKWLSKVFFSCHKVSLLYDKKRKPWWGWWIIISDHCQVLILLSAVLSLAKVLLTGGLDTLHTPGATTTDLFVCWRFANHLSLWLSKQCCYSCQVVLGGRGHYSGGVRPQLSGEPIREVPKVLSKSGWITLSLVKVT